MRILRCPHTTAENSYPKHCRKAHRKFRPRYFRFCVTGKYIFIPIIVITHYGLNYGLIVAENLVNCIDIGLKSIACAQIADITREQNHINIIVFDDIQCIFKVLQMHLVILRILFSPPVFNSSSVGAN